MELLQQQAFIKGNISAVYLVTIFEHHKEVYGIIQKNIKQLIKIQNKHQQIDL